MNYQTIEYEIWVDTDFGACVVVKLDWSMTPVFREWGYLPKNWHGV